MICYKDMTFCSRDCANKECERNKQNIDKPPQLEWMLVAYSDFKSCEKFKNMEIGGVMVVRCKDCRYWNSETKGCKRNPSVEAWREDDFCKYGKRWSNAID